MHTVPPTAILKQIFQIKRVGLIPFIMDIQFTLLGEKIDVVLSLLREISSCNCGRKEELIQWHSKEDVIEHK